jgi:hypothetical protein
MRSNKAAGIYLYQFIKYGRGVYEHVPNYKMQWLQRFGARVAKLIDQGSWRAYHEVEKRSGGSNIPYIHNTSNFIYFQLFDIFSLSDGRSSASGGHHILISWVLLSIPQAHRASTKTKKIDRYAADLEEGGDPMWTIIKTRIAWFERLYVICVVPNSTNWRSRTRYLRPWMGCRD